MPGRSAPQFGIVPEGFPRPRSNWFRAPNHLTDVIAHLVAERSYAEIVVLIYIMRHTWGYSEFDTPKHITLDEFQYGRQYRDMDRTRIDDGTGLTRSAIQRALKRLAARNMLDILTDDTDPGRIRKSYRLRVRPINHCQP